MTMKLTPKTALVVIDPQRAFVDREGSLIRTFGMDEAQPGLAALDRLRQFIDTHRATGRTIFVRSEYHAGQFTDGDLNHGMAYVCVPGRNIDCEWAAGLHVAPHDIVVTKHHADAATSDAFRAAIERAIQDGADRIVITGFQFTTCVLASAVSTLEMVGARSIRVTVVEPLTGSRASSHVRGSAGISRVEAARRQLASAGVEVITDVAGV